ERLGFPGAMFGQGRGRQGHELLARSGDLPVEVILGGKFGEQPRSEQVLFLRREFRRHFKGLLEQRRHRNTSSPSLYPPNSGKKELPPFGIAANNLAAGTDNRKVPRSVESFIKTRCRPATPRPPCASERVPATWRRRWPPPTCPARQPPSRRQRRRTPGGGTPAGSAARTRPRAGRGGDGGRPRRAR